MGAKKWEIECVWLVKLPPGTCLVFNWQLTSLASEVSHNNQF